MRLMRLCTNNAAFLEGFYAARPGLEAEPYAAQHRALAEQCHGWADYWTVALVPLGWEVWEPVGNAWPQQRRWAGEHGFTFGDDPLREISLAQVAAFRPDVLLVNDHHSFDRAFFEAARAACPSLRLVVGWCGAPYWETDVFRAYDLTLTNVASIEAGLSALGVRVRRFLHGFPEVAAERAGAKAPRAGFLFSGSVINADKYHTERLQLLAHVMGHTDIRVHTGDRKALLAAGVDEARIHGPLFGTEMFRALGESAVVLNSHIDISLDCAGNMRLFEATGMGACLLTDRTPDLAALFEPDVELAVYSSPEEAVEKARWLLDHPAEARAMAEAGRSRTLAEHTFTHRAEALDALLRAEL
ncbi:MAG: glycosyltransferase [Desulfovibrionaceae bacterium]